MDDLFAKIDLRYGCHKNKGDCVIYENNKNV